MLTLRQNHGNVTAEPDTVRRDRIDRRCFQFLFQSV